MTGLSPHPTPLPGSGLLRSLPRAACPPDTERSPKEPRCPSLLQTAAPTVCPILTCCLGAALPLMRGTLLSPGGRRACVLFILPDRSLLEGRTVPLEIPGGHSRCPVLAGGRSSVSHRAGSPGVTSPGTQGHCLRDQRPHLPPPVALFPRKPRPHRTDTSVVRVILCTAGGQRQEA